MAIEIIRKSEQAYGAFNGGEIVENKPIGFDREGGKLRSYSNLFYWAFAEAKVDSTIGLHPHQGFEIMSFVLNGEIRHYDTAGKNWIPLQAGDVQIIRAGSGISHAEFMARDAQMFQIWFDPGLQRTLGQAASYDDYRSEGFNTQDHEQYLQTTLVGSGAPIRMDTPGVMIRRIGIKTSDVQLPLAEDKVHSIYVLSGAVQTEDQRVEQHDFIRIQEQSEWSFRAEDNTELFIISSPASLHYPTYKQLMQQRV